MPSSRITSTTSGRRCDPACDPAGRPSSSASPATACAIFERPAFPMQTKRTLSAGNGALGGRENELGLARAAEREGQRLHRLRNETVEREGAAPVGDLDQAGLAQDLQVVRRSEEHTSELQSLRHLVCRLLLEKKKQNKTIK